MNDVRVFPDPPARIHCVGIKGMGMTALAQLLAQQGYQVTGSDVAEAFPTDIVLSRLNIQVAENFAREHITKEVDVVVYSTAYTEINIERAAAAALNIPQWSYPELLGIVTALSATSIAVSGSHGKTTTTALVAQLLEAAGANPSAVVGAPVLAWGTNARVGSGDTFVFEADEYQNKFQHYQPTRAVITNIDYDHPDFFPTAADYLKVFVDFAARLPQDGLLVLSGDDPNTPAVRIGTSARVLLYGRGEQNDWRITNVVILRNQTSFAVSRHGVHFAQLVIPYPGEHYAMNALAALAVTADLGVTAAVAGNVLRTYGGTARRLEYVGEVDGLTILDDYAHHPTELRALIVALKAAYPDQQLSVIFQPHTYSRTAQMLTEFAEVLATADQAIVLPVYSSAREAVGTVTGQDLVHAIATVRAGVAIAAEDADAALAIIEQWRGHGARVIVTAGAGDVWQISRRILHGRNV